MRSACVWSSCHVLPESQFGWSSSGYMLLLDESNLSTIQRCYNRRKKSCVTRLSHKLVVESLVNCPYSQPRLFCVIYVPPGAHEPPKAAKERRTSIDMYYGLTRYSNTLYR